jgi:hypothetical protein
MGKLKRQICQKELTTQSDNKIKKWRPETTQKTGQNYQAK